MKYKQLKYFRRIKPNNQSKLDAINILLEEVQQTHTVYHVVSWDTYVIQNNDDQEEIVVEATLLVKEL